MAGRPTDYNPEIAAKICEAIATTSNGLDTICAEENMPSSRTVWRWLSINKEFCQNYVKAKQFQADIYFEQIIGIADTPKVGRKTVDKPSGVEVTEGDMIDHRRLQIDARKWVISKLLPKKYGDKLDVTSGGEPVSSTTIQLATGTNIKA